MTVSELRIGNYINVTNPSQCPFKIDGFEFSNKTNCKIFQGENPNQHPLTWYFQDLSPILLTEDWLFKFGFDGDGKIENEMFIFQIIFHDCYHITYKEKEGYGIGECFLQGFPSVHQLQNLYFAVTGEELTIKE